MKTLRLVFTAGFLATVSMSAQTILYSTLGPGQSFNMSASQAFQTQQNQTFSFGTFFTATGTGPLAQALFPVADSNGVLTFALYADNGGKPAASPLETWSNITVPIPTPPFLFSLQTLTSVVHPTLTAGNKYWFMATGASTGGGLLCPSAQLALQACLRPVNPDCSGIGGPFPGPTCSTGGNDLTSGALWKNASQGTGGGWVGLLFPSQIGNGAPPALELDGPGVPPGPPATPAPPSLILALIGLAGASLYQLRRRLAAPR